MRTPSSSNPSPPRTRRDPERRRRQIIEAAAELVVESGAARLTHRAVAGRAGVPLGSTTQYFTSLDELREAALGKLASDVEAYVASVVAALETTEDPAEHLARGLHSYLSDEHLVRADVMLSASALVDAQVRPLTDGWFAGLSAAMTPLLGANGAERVMIFIGGATWHTALQGSPPALETLTTALRSLFATAAGAGR